MRDEYILDRLMQGGTVSGETLSEEMGISRAAVWKGILRLREDGWQIDAAPRVGYQLISDEDGIMPMDIYPGLRTERYGRKIEYHREVNSTNARAREKAQQGEPDGTLVIGERQTAGRGRLNRSWESPAGSGIYMSLIMRPQLPLQRLALVTPAVALGVCRGLRSSCGIDARIKWPNDIVCSGKKLVGMLLDAQASTGMDGVEWVVAGIGINVHQREEDFPDEVRAKASSLDMLTGLKCRRADIIRAVLCEIENAVGMLTSGEDAEMMEQYAALSATLGRRVCVITSDKSYEAIALRLQSDGALVVQPDGAAEHPVYAGDVSVRGIMGYV